MMRTWTNEKEGIRFVIEHDECAQNPRKYSEPVGTWYGFPHRNREFGDEQIREDCFWARVEELLEEPFVKRWEIHCYDHGGSVFSLHEIGAEYADKWDTSAAGILVVTQKDIDRLGVKVEDIERLVQAEMAEYQAWANGDVWMVNEFKGETCSACGHIEWEPVDYVRGPWYGEIYVDDTPILKEVGIPADAKERTAAGWEVEEEV